MLSLGDIKNTVETCSKDFVGKKSPKIALCQGKTVDITMFRLYVQQVANI
jgi:hypothetical protein